MGIRKNWSLYRWTDSDTEAKVAVGTTQKQNSKFQYAGFTDIAAATATESEERWYGMKWLGRNAHSKVANPRLTKVHGTFQDGHTLMAGYTNSWATPKIANVPSSIANTQIPSNLITSSELTIDTYDATDEEYQFIVLQHWFETGVTAFDPGKQTGDSGYAIVELAIPLTDRDLDNVPGGDDQEAIYNNTNCDLFMVLDQGSGDEMQLFGCTQNAVSIDLSPSFEGIVKGALQGARSYALTGRNKVLTGNYYSLNTFNWVQFFHGRDLGSDGWYRQVQITDDYVTVEGIDLVFDMLSNQGLRTTLHFPDAVFRASGGINGGEPGTMVPFEIMGVDVVNIYTSEYLLDVQRFKVGITLT
jgi:hypothetical protein